MNNTSFTPHFTNYRDYRYVQARRNAIAAGRRYADYEVFSGGRIVGKVSFPDAASCANWGNVCFYDPTTDSFLGDTVVGEYTLKRVK